MAAGRTAQARRKSTKRPPSYYKNLRQELAAKGRTAPKHADNTKKSKTSLLKKWSRSAILSPRQCSSLTATNESTVRFCSEIDESPDSFLHNALAEDFKTFLQWTLDRYPTVRASESLNNYWRVLNMHILDQTGRELNDSIRRDVTNVGDPAAYPHAGAGLADWYVVDSTKKCWWTNTSSAGSRRRGASAVSMTSTTSSSTIGCMIISYSATSSNAITFLRASSWLRILVADRSPCSTPGHGLRTRTTLASRPTMPRRPASRKMVVRIKRAKAPRTTWTGMTTERRLSTRIVTSLPTTMEARTVIATATVELTMASMQAWMRPDLCFGDTSLSSLLPTASPGSPTSSSPR